MNQTMVTWLRNWVSHNRIWATLLISIPFFGIAEPTLLSIEIGLPIILVGEAIRTWSSGHLIKNDILTLSGPYRLTRNPLYFGNFVLGLGFVVMSGIPFFLLLFVPIFFFVYDATIIQEEKFLIEHYGDEYRKYQKAVPRFFPRIDCSAFSNGSFDWALVQKHREKNTWWAILGCLLIFIVDLWI